MNGLGMIPQQAKFKISKDYSTIHVDPTAPDNGKVTVNGNLIKEKTELKHKDTIVFGLKNMSGVGISFGADRIYDVLEDQKLFPSHLDNSSDILFINFSSEDIAFILPHVQILRNQGLIVEIYPEADKLKKQFKYADQKKIPWVAMVGSEERTSNICKIKNMHTGEEKSVPFDQLSSSING